jgi:hypothetical protein
MPRRATADVLNEKEEQELTRILKRHRSEQQWSCERTLC